MEKRTYADIEKELNAHLSANLSKEHLANVSKSIANAHNFGFHIIDWHNKGTPPFERFIVQAQLPINEAAALTGLLQNDLLKEIRVFRKGIPKPEFFQIDLTIDKSSQQR